MISNTFYRLLQFKGRRKDVKRTLYCAGNLFGNNLFQTDADISVSMFFKCFSVLLTQPKISYTANTKIRAEQAQINFQ